MGDLLLRWGRVTYTEDGIIHAHDNEAKKGNAEPENVASRRIPLLQLSVTQGFQAIAVGIVIRARLRVGLLDILRGAATFLRGTTLLVLAGSGIDQSRHIHAQRPQTPRWTKKQTGWGEVPRRRRARDGFLTKGLSAGSMVDQHKRQFRKPGGYYKDSSRAHKTSRGRCEKDASGSVS